MREKKKLRFQVALVNFSTMLDQIDAKAVYRVAVEVHKPGNKTKPYYCIAVMGDQQPTKIETYE